VSDVYLAGPLGFSESGRRYHHEVVLPAVTAAGYLPLDPWADDQGMAEVLALSTSDARRGERLAAVNDAIGRRNAEMIRCADIILAILDGPDVDSGTAAEIGYAAALEIPVIGLRTDTRRSGDNDATVVNLQIEWFIRHSGGSITDDLPTAIQRMTEACPPRCATGSRRPHSLSPGDH
jgi:nucleoside 2-deoxyribosyltransferase